MDVNKRVSIVNLTTTGFVSLFIYNTKGFI